MFGGLRQWYWRLLWGERGVCIDDSSYSNSPFLWFCDVGGNSRISPNCYVRGEGVDAYGNYFRDRIVIGSNCHLGFGCFVKHGVRIGDNSIVGANSVVTRDVPCNEVWGGVPARKIKDRRVVE